MIRELYQDIHTHFKQLPNRSPEEQALLDRMNEGYFPITTVHRDDLALKGFDISNISDEDMAELSQKMASAYCDNCFWEDMVIIAGNMGLPKHPNCPKCGYRMVMRDNRTNSLCCNFCGQQWSDSYTLVEDPDQTDQLPKYIGYPSCEARNSNARYIPVYDYIRIFGQDPEANSYFKPVRWPESRKFMPQGDPENEREGDSIQALCESINDEQGVADFGSSAYWVPLCMLK